MYLLGTESAASALKGFKAGPGDLLTDREITILLACHRINMTPEVSTWSTNSLSH